MVLNSGCTGKSMWGALKKILALGPTLRPGLFGFGVGLGADPGIFTSSLEDSIVQTGLTTTVNINMRSFSGTNSDVMLGVRGG